MWRRRARRKRGSGAVEPEELNLLPLMSLFVALVPTLLYSAVFVPVSALGLDFPGTGGSATEAALPLTLRLTGATIGIEGVPERVYPTLARAADAAGMVTPFPSDAARDTLARQLAEIRGLHPKAQGALLICSADVAYRDVVSVMDAVREAGLGSSTLLGAAP
jgi:biopolymer transport protein ExbD